MEIINRELAETLDAARPVAALRVDRRTLAKTRWRGAADDGREFGFELARPLRHGAAVFEGAARYVLEQQPEPVLRFAVTDPAEGAPVHREGLGSGAIFVEADPAVRQMLVREGVAFEETQAVFQPMHAGGHHHHH